MSQYAIIPIERIHDVQQEYIVGPLDWQVEKDGVQYGGMEAIVFTIEQRSEIELLGGQCFYNAKAFQDWQSGDSVALAQVIRDRRFGEVMINSYLAQNKEMELSVTDSLSQLAKFGNVKMLLEVGAIRPALVLIQQTVIDDVYTQQRKDDDISKINEYLGL